MKFRTWAFYAGFLGLFITFSSNSVSAQNAAAASKYLETIGNEFQGITSDMWDYSSAVAHGKSARKVEKRRKEVLQSNKDAQAKISKMSPFEGDASFRDSVLAFLRLSYNVINYDYAKIVDMEAISEQSYDAMEAYLLAQEMASKKLNASSDMLNAQQLLFASKHSITISDSKSKISKNLEVAGRVFKYYNGIYLIFFKSYKQEAYMLDALNKNDINALKQNADALSKCSQEGIKRIDTCKAFNGDASLKTSCKDMLNFYKMESTQKATILINFSVKRENFQKLKAAYEAKAESKRTKADADALNKAVAEFNKASNEYNQINSDLNTKRAELLDKWNDSVTKFTDKQVPKK
jgi:hypothetical protein